MWASLPHLRLSLLRLRASAGACCAIELTKVSLEGAQRALDFSELSRPRRISSSKATAAGTNPVGPTLESIGSDQSSPRKCAASGPTIQTLIALAEKSAVVAIRLPTGLALISMVSDSKRKLRNANAEQELLDGHESECLRDFVW